MERSDLQLQCLQSHIKEERDRNSTSVKHCRCSQHDKHSLGGLHEAAAVD